jgi:hypothetical protein
MSYSIVNVVVSGLCALLLAGPGDLCRVVTVATSSGNFPSAQADACFFFNAFVARLAKFSLRERRSRAQSLHGFLFRP